MFRPILDVTAIILQTPFLMHLFVQITLVLGETPFLGHVDLKIKTKSLHGYNKKKLFDTFKIA